MAIDENMVVEPALHHIVTLVKTPGKWVPNETNDKHLGIAMDGVLTIPRRDGGWTIRYADMAPTVELDTEHFGRDKDNNVGRMVSSRYQWTGAAPNYEVRCELVVACFPRTMRATLDAEFRNIAAGLHDKLDSTRLGSWKVEAIDGEPYEATGEGEEESDPNESVGYTPFVLPKWDIFKTYFKHLFGMEDYVLTIYTTLEAAVKSNWRKRVNLAFIGPPACGKSELCKALVKALSEGVVLEMDGTATTAAGARDKIAKAIEMWRVIVLEELEKQDDTQTNWLLSVLDMRGEVKNVTKRGSIEKECHMIGICTVNDEAAFRKMNKGALASRFPLPLQFLRPSDEVLHKILARDIPEVEPFTGDELCEVCGKQNGGSHRWIVPTLKFAKVMQTTDPRKVVAFALTGREGLLDQTFQTRMLRIMKPEPKSELPQMKTAAELAREARKAVMARKSTRTGGSVAARRSVKAA